MATSVYYAICNVNGPISVRLDADSVDSAKAAFAALDLRACIDGARTDAEDDLEIDGSELGEDAFTDLLTEAGAESVADLDAIVNAHAGTTAHLSGGWMLWAVPAREYLIETHDGADWHVVHGTHTGGDRFSRDAADREVARLEREEPARYRVVAAP